MSIPEPMQVQLLRIFGGSSVELKSNERTNAEWKITLRKMLDELFKYAEENIQTDQLHWFMIYSGFAAANVALNDREFWPGFTEGIMRVCYLLMGDYPDHKNYKCGKKKKNHYSLNTLRTTVYMQSPEQKKRTIYVASAIGYPEININPRDAMSEYREEKGYDGGAADFLKWFKIHYPSAYSALF